MRERGHPASRLGGEIRQRVSLLQEGRTMSLRTFVDSSRREWLAFDVVPRADERRYIDRRGADDAEFDGENRRDSDRRLTVGGSGRIQGTEGWLCFECGDDRRRLSPIPKGWTRASD